MILSGKLEPSEQNHFTLEVRYRYTSDTGETFYDGKPILDEAGFNTYLGIKLGKPLTAAGMTTKNDKEGQQALPILTRYVLHLDKYEPMKP